MGTRAGAVGRATDSWIAGTCGSRWLWTGACAPPPPRATTDRILATTPLAGRLASPIPWPPVARPVATLAAPAVPIAPAAAAPARACDSTTAHPAGREHAAGRDRGPAARARAAQRDGAAAADREAQDRGLQADGRHHGQDGRERGALVANLALELRAAGAAVDVPAGHAAPRDPARDGRELFADLDARSRARLTRAHQRLPGLEHERLDLLAAHPEHLGDLRMGLVAELEEDERRALVLGQALQLVDELTQVGPELNLGRHPLDGAGLGRQPVGGDLRALRPQGREAAIARDRVQPGAQLDVARTAAQSPIRRGEAVLQGILRLLATAEHVPAEGQQALVVAVEDDLERRVVSRAHAGDEAIVAHAWQPPRARRPRRTYVDRGGGHRASMRHPAREM